MVLNGLREFEASPAAGARENSPCCIGSSINLLATGNFFADRVLRRFARETSTTSMVALGKVTSGVSHLVSPIQTGGRASAVARLRYRCQAIVFLGTSGSDCCGDLSQLDSCQPRIEAFETVLEMLMVDSHEALIRCVEIAKANRIKSSFKVQNGRRVSLSTNVRW